MTPQRLDVVFQIHWTGRWHVGSGYESAGADRLIRRLGGSRGAPFVPGSQIKGVLRHHCERVLMSFGGEAVDPHATSGEQTRKLVEHFGPLARSRLMVDRLFGTRYQGECLFVDNALPRNTAASVSSLRTRTAVDRVSGTVLEQHLFTTEYAEGAESALDGRLRARHPAGVLTCEGDGFPYEYALLIAALLSLDNLGGDKSAGLGRCRFEIPPTGIIWNGETVEARNALASFEQCQGEWLEWVETVRAESQE